MRILFFENHPMWIHGLPNGFCDAAHQVMISGPLTEHNIPEMISCFQPDLLISMGWTPEHTPVKQGWIRKFARKSGIPCVYWATEDPTFTESFTLPLIRNMQPDFVFTVCPSLVKYYQELGIKAAHLDFGYHASVHHEVACQEIYCGSIAVVANAYPDVLGKYPDHFRINSLYTLVRPLLKENIRIDFYGQDWEKMHNFLDYDLPRDWIHGYLPYTEANKVYSSVDIIIGLQNYQNQLTQRTYEIVGSGGFLLTSDTPEIRRVFTPGKDLIVSSSPEETIKLVQYYLLHPEERAQIRTQGRIAIQNDTYRHRAEYMIEQLVINGILGRNLVSTATEGEVSFFPQQLYEKYHLHTVKAGDTLWEISKRYGITVEELKRLNGLTSDLIYIDQILRIGEREPDNLLPGERGEAEHVRKIDGY